MSSPDESGDEVLDLGRVEGSYRENRGTFCLVEKLCTERSYNMYALMDVMIKAFKCRTKAAVREWGNKLLIFTFMEESDREWVIRNQPWHFDGHLFAVKSLTGTEQPSGVQITRASFWARVYDLHIICHSEATLISIAKRIGELEVFEPPDRLNLGYYLCFKVSIDITKPLMRVLPIKLKGEDLWIPIKYEALPFYCFCYGLVGHNFRGCDSYDKNDCPDPTEMEYGPFLKASPIKKGRGPKMELKTTGGDVGNAGKSTWKRSAREKGKGVVVVGVAETGEGGKRGAEVLGDEMDIDGLLISPKRGHFSGELVSLDDDSVSAVDATGHHCRDQ
ncbi:hypothetical protein ACS0TY_010861 [Phlomoides rotata]